MISVHVVGRVKMPLEEKITSTGKKCVKMGLSVPIHRNGKKDSLLVYGYIWDNRFEKMIPFIEKETGLFIGGTLEVQSYLSRAGEPCSMIGINVKVMEFVPQGTSKEGGNSSGRGTKEVPWEEGLF